METETTGEVRIRSFRREDLEICRQLYLEGMLGGTLAEHDSGLDIDDIHNNYIEPQGNHFWVAENERNEVVGMIGVIGVEGAGEIRRLRVRQDQRRKGIGSKLLETAVRFCRDRHYLKVTLDTFTEREPALKLFEKFQFLHSRTKKVAGKDLHYFYLDLYTSDRKDS